MTGQEKDTYPVGFLKGLGFLWLFASSGIVGLVSIVHLQSLPIFIGGIALSVLGFVVTAAIGGHLMGDPNGQ